MHNTGFVICVSTLSKILGGIPIIWQISLLSPILTESKKGQNMKEKKEQGKIKLKLIG
jgi:hypothetical protein